MDIFWEYYRGIEKGTKVTFEEFSSNKQLKKEVTDAIKGLYTLILQEVQKKLNLAKIESSDFIWDLARLKAIKPELIQEYLDIIDVVSKIDKVDDLTLYTMLVRIMEDLEELYFSIIKFKTD
ncbi:hypothetical protein [Stygiolobus caldivivus]|uniref:Uncharacterized protein n=1 Tax=Stygiolobus caldivivus TaxID=2824673 RepID=A0A8D5U4F0_9CREN|nr:hypothetical protein [Stygiolobus caldivivus]BCU69265.1 hypothetical protein KN1_05620 [Stygiolobus caldivivus]